MLDARPLETAYHSIDSRHPLDIRDELEKARLRLLDLSARNPLVSFRLATAKPSKNFLRFVDAIPEAIFQRLVRDALEVTVQPVPAPARLTDETLLLEEFSNEEDEAEGEMPRVPGGRVAPANTLKAEAQARRLGISTSFDLPEAGAGSDLLALDDFGRGDVLRALLYPHDLEIVLKNLATINKTRIDETGIGTLYVVFGLLEWYESEDAISPRYAPLLLVPARVKKGSLDSRTASFPYAIEHTGEDVESNITLREKLKEDFSLGLPEFAEGDTLAQYFAKVECAVRPKPRWTVRRQIVLANLSFHKLRIWQDLDPGQWPNGELLAHPVVNELFLGTPHDGSLGGEEYAIDDLEIDRALPPLVYDADSSQHSALIDAMRGKNLVIEGPPGTGKSQTITNLIAAAMAEGKTVLFVAEKTTALGIVRKKLTAAGLGEFCLSLGVKSDGQNTDVKVLLNTKDVAEDLKRRLDAKNSYRPPAMLAQKKQALDSCKLQLIDYVETINCEHGACGRTIQQIIGARDALREQLGAAHARLEKLHLPDAEQMSIAHVERMRQTADVYAASLRRVGEAGGPRSHPWSGLLRQPEGLAEEERLVASLRDLQGIVQAIARRIEELREESSLDLRKTGLALPDLLALDSIVASIRPPRRTNLLRALSDREGRERRARVRSLGERLRRFRELRDRLAQEFGRLPELDASELEILRKTCADAAALDAGSMSIGEIRTYIRWIDSFLRFLTRCRHRFEEICAHLGCALPYDANSFAVLVNAIALLRETPWDALRHRHPVFDREGVGAAISRARKEAERLRAQANDISRFIDWNLTPARDTLARHAVACANAGLFRFADAEFRRARKDWHGMSTRRRKATPELMAEEYRALIHYFDELNLFSSNAEWRESLESLFNGMNTPFDEFEALARWYEQVRTKLGRSTVAQRQVADALLTAPASNLKALEASIQAHPGEFEQWQKIFGHFAGVAARLPQPIQETAQRDLQDFADRLRALQGNLEAIAAIFSDFGIETEIPLAALPERLEMIHQFLALGAEIRNDRVAAEILGEPALDPEMEFSDVEAAIVFIEQLEATALPEEIRDWLLTAEIDSRLDALRGAIRQLSGAFAEFQTAKETFLRLSDADPAAWLFDEVEAPGMEPSRVEARLQAALAALPDMAAWLAYQRARQALADFGFTDLIDPAEGGALASGAIPAAAMFVYQNSLLRDAFERYPYLSQFDGLAHEETRARFAAIDQEVIQLTREEIAARIDQRAVPLGNRMGRVSTYTELGLLQHLIGSPGMRLKIRQLVERAAGALLALKPCFMMSPLSVAQYLPPGAIKFDLVVMDEASQLKPEDALGAVARGAQLVVVGDRLQLPPTDFFNATVGAGEDEDGAEAESILEMASRRYQPPRMLKWHYRSQHESLIAFSNREFYDNQLIVFPSTRPADEGHGVKFVFVAGGVYEQNRNRAEAERVVAYLIEHLNSRPRESIGVVGLNLKQRELIDELLEKTLPAHPVAERRFREWAQANLEVFVKNLETVQGDERDVILVSATVGRDAAGSFKLTSLGALNHGKYGHRRLNVLITRARKRVVVFSSIDPEEIRPSHAGSWGQRAFKEYLAFAKTGTLEQRRETGHAPDSEFEIMVADAIRKRGYEVVPQVGVARYRLDLAVRHPELPGAYILGVECDGATYHSSRSARDRDRLRQAVLEGLGWEIHRIWSTDWFRNREGEVEKVVRRIEALRSGGRGESLRRMA